MGSHLSHLIDESLKTLESLEGEQQQRSSLVAGLQSSAQTEREQIAALDRQIAALQSEREQHSGTLATLSATLEREQAALDEVGRDLATVHAALEQIASSEPPPVLASAEPRPQPRTGQASTPSPQVTELESSPETVGASPLVNPMAVELATNVGESLKIDLLEPSEFPRRRWGTVVAMLAVGLLLVAAGFAAFRTGVVHRIQEVVSASLQP